MIDRDALSGMIGLGMFVGIGGLLLVFAQPPGSAEQVLSVCSAAMGAALVLGVILVTRLQRGKGR
jgi:hypothetical protein